MIQIWYQKRNGEVFQRIRSTPIEHRVGEYTSMGWKVLAIKYLYGKRFYSKDEYDYLIDKHYKRHKRIFKLKKKLSYLYRNLIYFFSLMVLFRLFELTIKISF